MAFEMEDEIIVCLFDGDFHMGFAALANSLVQSGYKGLINAGYRGSLPLWVNQLKSLGDNHFCLAAGIIIHFNKVDTEMHLGYFKPFFIKETFNSYPAASKIFFFDTDIIINAPWSFFSKWLDKGICLCLDGAFHFLHTTHPWRKDWKLLANAEETSYNKTHYYFNSGFIATERESINLIDKWADLTKKYIRAGGNVDFFSKDAYISVKGDQDLLNAAITVSTDIEINIMGKEGMGFTLPATSMYHAIGFAKPWNKSFLGHLIKSGQKPTLPDQKYFTFCKYPICIFPPFVFRIKKLDLLSASVFGRFLG